MLLLWIFLRFIRLTCSLVTVAVVQSFFAIIMLLLPNLRMFILATILNYDPSEDKLFRPDLYIFRGFGMSQDILFSLSIVQGIAVACVLSLCLYNFAKYKYSLLLIPPLLLSIALNARIGFVALISLVLVTLIFNVFRLKIYLVSKLIMFSAISCLIIYIAITNVGFFLELDIEKNLTWASSVFVQGKNFATGADSNTGHFGKITREYLHLPKTESERLFGEGRYVFGTGKHPLASDVGYVRKVYFGGYIYSFLTYAALIYLFWGSQRKISHKISHKAFAPLFYSLLLTAFIAQFKGDMFLPIPGFRVVFLIFLFAISERRLSRPAIPQINRRFIPWYPHETPNLRPYTKPATNFSGFHFESGSNRRRLKDSRLSETFIRLRRAIAKRSYLRIRGFFTLSDHYYRRL